MQVNLIDQNLAAQDNILAALTDVYAQTANVRKNVEEMLKRREITISSLIASYDAYEDLLAKSSKGLEFYRKLEINVSKLLQRVKSTCKVQEEEREQILAQDSKNTYEKANATTPSSTYDQQARPRSNNLKLKDYLNSRIESGTGYQNPYYSLYKGHVTAMQMDSMPKPTLTTDNMADKSLVQIPGAIPGATAAVSEIPSSTSVKSSQHYYPTTYTDYRSAGSSYSYSTQSYYENPIVNNAINQNYRPTTSTIATSVYQQPIFSASSASASTSGVQYPASSYLPNSQALPASANDPQDKYRDASQSAYNVPNVTLQYDAYHQPPAGYNSYNVATPYAPNQDKVAVKGGTLEMSQHQVQPVPSQIPVSTISGAAAGVTMTVNGQASTSYNVMQQDQSSYDNQQQTVLPGQEMPHGGQNAVRTQSTLPAKDNTPTQSYPLPQAELTYPQGYSFYAPADLQAAQRSSFTHGTYDTTQYMQSQPSTNNQQQPVLSATSTNEISSSSSSSSMSYASNLQQPGVIVNPAQYNPQQTTGTSDQGKQTYADNTYASYGTQVQMNPGYPSAYQNYQHGSATAYQQQQQTTGMAAVDASNAYAYMNNSSNSEMIQSHAKPVTTVQSYSQSYQYPHQDAYAAAAGYVQYPSYSQAQNYAYIQQPAGANPMAYPYNLAGQGYAAYAANSAQTTQAAHTLDTAATADSIPPASVTICGGYQQQETNARYTNAGNNAVVTQTASSQYSQVPQPQAGNDTYYTTPYGLQMQQGQGSSILKRPDRKTEAFHSASTSRHDRHQFVLVSYSVNCEGSYNGA